MTPKSTFDKPAVVGEMTGPGQVGHYGAAFPACGRVVAVLRSRDGERWIEDVLVSTEYWRGNSPDGHGGSRDAEQDADTGSEKGNTPWVGVTVKT